MDNNDNSPGTALRRTDLLRVVWRSFFIQAQFTLKEKLGAGFGFALIPGIKKIAGSEEKALAVVRRHTEYFNTHPFLASYVIGAVLRLEEQECAAPGDAGKSIDNLKTRLAGILGSLGDRLFWKYLKPASSLAALVYIFSCTRLYPWNAVAGIAAFLIIFNVMHLYYRIGGVIKGYRSGAGIVRDRSILVIENINVILTRVSLLFLGIVAALESRLAFEGGTPGVLIFICALIITFILNHKKAAPGLGLAAGLCSSIVIFALWKVISG